MDPHLEKSWRPLVFPFNAVTKAMLDIHQRTVAVQIRETRMDQRYY